jgi:chloramphenicol 3-O phosphotransferase
VQAPGTVVVLNGPSSAGKSTLAKATRKLLGVTCMAVSPDRLAAFAHPDHPLDERLYATLSDATFGVAVTAATAGFDVIVDTVFEQRERFESARRAFASMRHFYVAVTCPLDKLEAREHARGNRPLGLARRQHTAVFYDAPYVLELDTDLTPLEVCAEQVARLFPRRA